MFESVWKESGIVARHECSGMSTQHLYRSASAPAWDVQQASGETPVEYIEFCPYCGVELETAYQEWLEEQPITITMTAQEFERIRRAVHAVDDYTDPIILQASAVMLCHNLTDAIPQLKEDS